MRFGLKTLFVVIFLVALAIRLSPFCLVRVGYAGEGFWVCSWLEMRIEYTAPLFKEDEDHLPTHETWINLACTDYLAIETILGNVYYDVVVLDSGEKELCHRWTDPRPEGRRKKLERLE